MSKHGLRCTDGGRGKYAPASEIGGGGMWDDLDERMDVVPALSKQGG